MVPAVEEKPMIRAPIAMPSIIMAIITISCFICTSLKEKRKKFLLLKKICNIQKVQKNYHAV